MIRPPDETYERGVAAYEAIPEDVETDISKMGFGVATRPSIDGVFQDLPTMPLNLGDISFKRLQTLIGVFTAWYAYAMYQYQLSSVSRNAAEKKRSFVWGRLRRALRDGTVADKDDAVRVDRRYVQADTEYEFHDGRYRILGGICDRLKRDIDTISRAISALENRLYSEGRSAAAGSREPGRAGDAFRRGRRSAYQQETRPSAYRDPKPSTLHAFRKNK
jgi:hypothetical protein